MASGPCGCPPYDECHSISALTTARDEGALELENRSGTLTSWEQELLATVKSWDGAACPDADQFRAISSLSHEDQINGYDYPASVKQQGDECCYHMSPSCDGRPFLVGGAARVARVRDGSSNPTHAALAQAWLADALAEHASVAAFARLTLQLMALGAPANLIEKSQRASLDELRHAEYCFERASRHGGARYVPAALPMAGALDDCSLTALIESNLLEGCIGETLASERLRCRAERTHDPELRSALLAISDDEQRHAELAFEILAWCREVAPALTTAVVERVLATTRLASSPARDGDALFVSERATRAALQQREHEVWHGVIQPILRASCEIMAA
jgi:hypothetical protein